MKADVRAHTRMRYARISPLAEPTQCLHLPYEERSLGGSRFRGMMGYPPRGPGGLSRCGKPESQGESPSDLSFGAHKVSRGARPQLSVLGPVRPPTRLPIRPPPCGSLSPATPALSPTLLRAANCSHHFLKCNQLHLLQQLLL